MKNKITTPQEANKIIAEFMGVALETFLTYNRPSYSESLDALMPVWEKLDASWFSLNFRGRTLKSSAALCMLNYEESHCSDTLNFKELSAIATAKAITSHRIMTKKETNK